MEILFEEVLWLEFILSASLFGAGILALGVIAFSWFKDYKKTRDKSNLYVFYFLIFFIVIMLSVVLSFGKAPKQITAKVTDIDEVYDNGYEIVERKGENYIIRER